VNSKYNRRSSLWFTIGLGLLLSMGVIHALRLGQTIQQNLGWVALARSLYYTEPDNPWPDQAKRYWAASSDFASPRVYLGIGLAEARQGHSQAAFDAWTQGSVDPALLLHTGRIHLNRAQPDVALNLYRGADHQLQRPGTTEAQKGMLCRGIRRELMGLGADDESFCRTYFASGNWVADGQFEDTSLASWLEYADTKQVPYLLASSSDSGRPAPSLEVRVTSPVVKQDQEAGVYQLLPMRPGERVRFSGWFRIAHQEDFAARLLYVEWLGPNGRAAGNQGATFTTPTDWVYLEREFELTSEGPQIVRFFPALVSGTASIWVDDIQVELLGD